jgi:hypothetical protein
MEMTVARGAWSGHRRRESKKNGRREVGWGIEPWAKRVSLCLGGRRRTRSPRHPDGSSRGAVALDGRDCAEHGVLGLKCARRLPRGTHVLSRGSYGMGPRRTLRIRPPPMTSLEIAGIVFYSLYSLKILRLSLSGANSMSVSLLSLISYRSYTLSPRVRAGAGSDR